MSVAVNNDAELVNGTLEGNRDAFSQIVSRYQSLICSLAYSATGSLGQSEDLAQETFITAWKHLGHLRERDKLRSWLCGIARNRINGFLRREGREPIRAAEPLENIAESHSLEPLPADATISNEEQAILWRSLEKIPEIYREPLVLFYREHQSVEAVAHNLDLTGDTVKQRLSRGRKMLHEQVLAFVEGALERTNPGKAFTLAVIASLPALTISAKAATLGAAAAKGGATAKAAGALGLFGMVCSPLLVVFGNYAGYRMSLDAAQSAVERRQVQSFYRKICGVTLGCFAVFAALIVWLGRGPMDWVSRFGVLFTGLVVIYLLTLFAFAAALTWRGRKNDARALAAGQLKEIRAPAWEYRSRASLCGLPLVHIRLGQRFDHLTRPVRAWIAVADYAVGGLFAFGGVAIAPLSIGGVAVGFLPFGGLVAGIFAVGAVGFGAWSFGGVVAGWQAVGCLAIAWHAAAGNFALAHDFAVGGFAHAAQANNELARQFIESNLFFRWVQVIHSHWFVFNLIWIAPLIVQWQMIARARRRERTDARVLLHP